MSTDRQKSFIATIGTPTTLVHFLDEVLGEKATVSSSLFSGGFYTGKPQTQDHSHLVSLRPEPRLTLYFRYTGRDYSLYIRTPGPYYGKCLSIDENGLLGAFPSEGSKTFNLRNEQGLILPIDSVKTDTLNVYLQASGSPGALHIHRLHNSPFTYFANKSESPYMFNLTILERNAPYLGYPDEV
ncbi:hypothetical protein [Pseudomonas frederiksbergensis]|uniref:Uncharacterized protein n=1 Tax=Pseudomonas frederiksbergensis TaxID=104087 RepID=A0A6L5BNT6_9PSED|nr:hypothetical protein [Pseudomonas frederiksbergensis]KAF2390000.1 hypothetical protein FX983_04449 [Pseudomonas frederiksbergensis]